MSRELFTHADMPAGPVPMNPYVDEETRRRQVSIEADVAQLFDVPPNDIPEEFATLLFTDYQYGERLGREENFKAFSQWQKLQETIPKDLKDIWGYVLRGLSTEEETIEAGLRTKLHNFEIIRLTHPYKRRFEHLEPARQRVIAAIEARGGVVFPSITPYRSIDIEPEVVFGDGVDSEGFSPHQLQGLLPRYKHDIGYIDHENDSGAFRLNLVERQVAGYRIDEASGFPQDIVERMLEVKLRRTMQHRLGGHVAYMLMTGCQTFVERAIQTDSLADFVVPESTTIFGFKTPIPEKRDLALSSNVHAIIQTDDSRLVIQRET